MSRSRLPTYAAIGGLHTCGYAPLTQPELLRTIVFKSLRQLGAVKRIQNSCTMGAGPTYPACCMPYFVPKATRFATLDFVSSLQSNRALHLHYVEKMLQYLLENKCALTSNHAKDACTGAMTAHLQSE